MKTKITLTRTNPIGLAALLLSTFTAFYAAQPTAVFAQGTAFTYQGRLNDGANPAGGIYDLRFTIYDLPAGGSVVAGPVTNAATTVSNGLFTAELDFGADVFTGDARWLDIAVRTNGATGFTALAPRQSLTPAPYALRALNAETADSANSVAATNIAGVVALAQLPGVVLTNGGSGVVLTGTFSGSGSGLTGLNASQLSSGTVPDARLSAAVAHTNEVWLLYGNSNIKPSHYIGTADDMPLVFRVNGLPALRLEPATNGSLNIIGGASINHIARGVIGSVIAGGGTTNLWFDDGSNSIYGNLDFIGAGWVNTIGPGFCSVIVGGELNQIQTWADYSAIGGGTENTIQTNAFCSVISGGTGNIIGTESVCSTICGGVANTILAGSSDSFIGGGSDNVIEAGAYSAVISGGYVNIVRDDAMGSVISGGWNNTVLSNAQYAIIPGGRYNLATNLALAAGHRARALHRGAFVWADSTDAYLSSTNADSVTMRAGGGYRLFSNTNATAGVYLAAGDGSWTSMSDRNAKENILPINSGEVLAKVAALPLTTWNYKSQDASIRHLGPIAQDFKAAFGLGETDTGITGVDADGVALAAIQGLNQKLNAETAALRAENAELRARLEKLEQFINQRSGGVQ